MKKSISIIFCLVLLMSAMTGCRNSAENDVRPDDTNNGRPGITDNVDQGNDGVINDNITPDVTDHPVTDEVENGMERAGNAVRNGVDNVGNAVKDAADDLTGR